MFSITTICHLRSPRFGGGSLLYWGLLLLCGVAAQPAAAANVLNAGVTAGAPNRLVVERAPASSATVVAFESSPAATGGQINIYFGAEFEFLGRSMPAGWRVDVTSVDATRKVASLSFSGFDGANAFETYNFNAPLAVEFDLGGLDASVRSAEVHVEARVSVLVPGSGYSSSFSRWTANVMVQVRTLLAGWRASNGLPADGSGDLAGRSGNGVSGLLYYAFGMGDPSSGGLVYADRTRNSAGLPVVADDGDGYTFSYVRHRWPDSGVRYRVVVSRDFITWEDVTTLGGARAVRGETKVVLDANYELVTLRFPGGRPREYVRVDVSRG